MSKPSWKDAPNEANWLAMDSDGSWWFYHHKPIAIRDMFVVSDGDLSDGVDYGSWKAGKDYPSDEWENTLEHRGTAKEEKQTMDGEPRLNPETLYIEIPIEHEIDLTRTLLMKQLGEIESGIESVLSEQDASPHRGQDMVYFASVRAALIEVINFNSLPEDQLSMDWLSNK